MKTKGWKQVFGFTYLQNVKSKSFRVSTIIMSLIIILICVGINIIPTLVSDEQLSNFFNGDGSISDVKTLYLCDESGLSVPMELSAFTDEGVRIAEITSAELSEKQQEVTDSLEAVALLHVIKTEGGDFELTVYRPESEELVSGGTAELFAGEAKTLLNNALLISNGVSADNLEAVKASISTDVLVYSAEPGKTEIQMAVNAIIPMFSALIFFSFIISYSQLIGQSVATEKTSRVMELLLTSVRPLAVIVGKVLAMLCVALTQIFVFGACGTAGFLISLPFGFIPKTIGAVSDAAGAVVSEAAGAGGSEVLNELGTQISEAIPGFNVLTIIEIILVFIMGFLFYALLAGLVGASISRMEDLATAMQPMMLIAMAGFFLSYFPAVFNVDNESGNNVVLTIAQYLPISSPFALPSALLLGSLSTAEAAASVLALAVFVVLTAMLVAKVYEHIVLYSGNPLKFSQLLKFAKNDK